PGARRDSPQRAGRAVDTPQRPAAPHRRRGHHRGHGHRPGYLVGGAAAGRDAHRLGPARERLARRRGRGRHPPGPAAVHARGGPQRGHSCAERRVIPTERAAAGQRVRRLRRRGAGRGPARGARRSPGEPLASGGGGAARGLFRRQRPPAIDAVGAPGRAQGSRDRRLMSRFLVTCWPFVGHLYPQISAAHALRDRGHEVAFYSHESARATVEGQGFTLFPFVHVDDRRYERIHVLMGQVPATQSMHRTLSVALRAYRDMLADAIPEQMADLQPIVGRWRPDVVVTDPAMWASILVLWEVTGIPVALLSQMIGSLIPGPHAPPWGPGLPPPRTLGTRLLARATQLGVDVVAHGVRRHVNRIRSRYGLRPMGCSVNAFTGRLPLYLIPSVPELDYNRRDQPPNVHYIGPCVWTNPGAASLEWLEE